MPDSPTGREDSKVEHGQPPLLPDQPCDGDDAAEDDWQSHDPYQPL